MDILIPLRLRKQYLSPVLGSSVSSAVRWIQLHSRLLKRKGTAALQLDEKHPSLLSCDTTSAAMSFFSRLISPFSRRSSLTPAPSSTDALSTDTKGVLDLPGGATIAYQVLGSQHLKRAIPIVFIPGMSSLVTDYETLTSGLAKTNTRSSRSL
jgi:hypothetical protein